MESVRDLISFFLKVSAAIFIVVLLIVLTKAVPRKNTNVNTNASSTPKVDLLPSPRKYSGMFSMSSSSRRSPAAPTFSTFSYSGPIAFSSSSMYQVNYNTPTSYNSYTTGGSPSQPQGQATSPAFQNQSPTSTVPIRNLSIYQGGHVYTGLSFVGEARSQMFREGKFPIIVIDAAGRTVGVTAAVAQTAWTVPGWVRFETRITYPLPSNVPCTMIFEEALTQTERNRTPVRVALPISCN